MILLLVLLSFSLAASALSTGNFSSVSRLRIGTRPSNLALIQAKRFEAALLDAITTTENDDENVLQTVIVPIGASGDMKGAIAETQDVPLALKGVDFTGNLDDAVVDGKIDVAVHSAKDVPPENRWRDGLTIGCHLERADPCDVLVGPYSSFADLPFGARVGSASIRRQAQLLSQRPDVMVVNVRGNVQARLAALENGDVDELILAAAGLDRLSRSGKSTFRLPEYHRIPVYNMLPGAAQGIIAVVCRADDDETLSLLQCLDNYEARIAATAERALLDVVDEIKHSWPGRPPVAAYMSPDGEGWTLRGLLATPDGTRVVRTLQTETSGCDYERAYELGQMAGKDLVNKAGTTFLVD